MAIVTHPANDAYRSGWDATFGRKEEVPAADGWVCILCTTRQNASGQRLEGEHTRNGPDANNGFPAGERCINEKKPTP